MTAKDILPVEKDENDEYEVEKILEMKTEDGTEFFKIRWLGYSPQDDTWEPLCNIGEDNVALELFKKEQMIKKSKVVSCTKVPNSKSSVGQMGIMEEEKKNDDDGSVFNSSKNHNEARSKRCSSARKVDYSELADDDDEEDLTPAQKWRRIFSGKKASQKSEVKKEESGMKKKGSGLKKERVTIKKKGTTIKKEGIKRSRTLASDSESFSLSSSSDDDDLSFDRDDSSTNDKKPKSSANKQRLPKKIKVEETKNKIDKPTKESEIDLSTGGFFKPKNNPAQFSEPFVDAVGFDPTSDIVEGILLNQVKKVGKLLLKAMEKEEMAPIRLQTACSGTDAPSIALSIIKECLDKLFRQNRSKQSESDNECQSHTHNFRFEHVMSCEIEPFKQAYISRNFPGTLLFPDICKLSQDKVVDVYGRTQTIPYGNLYVAGTSCKDFSMQKNTKRLDIEDKGQSGETFLAAVDFLEKKQPNMAIFENVDQAPWDKMAEYITGRLPLHTIYSPHKAIKKDTKKGSVKELMFSINADGKYVVEAVPSQVGVQAGSIIEGFLRPGKKVVMKINASSTGNSKPVSLDVIAKKHGIDKKRDTLVLEKQCRYCTYLAKVDTKKYGLPQTRNRKYLFVWKSEDPEDNLGEFFQEILSLLESPCKHSIDAFLLPPTHDKIRNFREALQSGPGQMLVRKREREPYFWENYGNRDLRQNKIFRKFSGIEDTARPITNWNRGGRVTLAPNMWSELLPLFNGRILDLIDCFYIASARDATPRDALHHSFTWNVSQNVTREPHRTATAGVCSCVTPGGNLYMPHLKRTILGIEKLLLQGIPFPRLLLGNETEVELSDLAGNAMSLPVVSATILAAICAKQLRSERKGKKNCNLMQYKITEKHDSLEGEVIPSRGDLYQMDEDTKSDCNIFDFFEQIVKLADDAQKTSTLCVCETSGCLSKAERVMQCSGCGFSICQKCCKLYNVKSHDLVDDEGISKSGRGDPTDFERRLRGMAPSSLYLANGADELLNKPCGLESYSFQLSTVKRGEGHWSLFYRAVEDFGSGRQVGEIRIDLGRMGRLQKNGLCAYIRCFGPSIRDKDPFRGPLPYHARLFIGQDTPKDEMVWQVRDHQKHNTNSSFVNIVGSGESPSFRVQVGINDDAQTSLESHKHASVPKVKTRNRLTHYHDKWKCFPSTIDISGDEANMINGTYERLSCQYTIVHSALWRRRSEHSNEPDLYFYMRPDVHRTSQDVAVVSTTPWYEDKLEIVEFHDWIPENSLVEKTHKTKFKHLSWKSSSVVLNVMKSKAIVVSPDKITADNIKDQFILCEVKGLVEETAKELCEQIEASGYLPGDQNIERCHEDEVPMILKGSGVAGTLITKRFTTIAGSHLLKYAAQGKLPLSLENSADAWIPISVEQGKPSFGTCPLMIPQRPREKWVKFDKRNALYERIYDAEQSQAYYLALLNRPKAWNVSVNLNACSLKVRMNPVVAAHNAAAALIQGRDVIDDLQVSIRLAELTSMAEADTTEFRVQNSDVYGETSVPGLKLPLFPRQAKALTRMMDIECGKVIFSEEERSEHVLPGVDWCLMGRATRNCPLKGGVLADAIGSGKTVVTIALILADIEKARKSRNPEKGISGATLIVLPPGLIDQWDDERKKFTGDKLKCLKIISTADLKRLSITDICNADIVIVPVGMLEESKGTERPYTRNLVRVSESFTDIPPAPTFYSQKEAPTIEGIWIPATSQDPYVGNKGNQRRRDVAAYYTHCYKTALLNLRSKAFKSSTRGVPIEYFTWRRVIVDECHESLCTARGEVTAESKSNNFSERNRRGAREFLGIGHTDPKMRPLRTTLCVWGLTGTPLLETEARVTELANLMGGTYVTGAAFHWRREERESGRDMFLNYQDESRSREYRRAIQTSAQLYVRQAVQRNRANKINVDVENVIAVTKMSDNDNDKLNSVKKGVKCISTLDEFKDEEIEKLLCISSKSDARGKLLMEKIEEIMKSEPETKIIVFADTRHGGHENAIKSLRESRRDFAHIGDETGVLEQNEIISWFRHVDVTEKDRSRPRILLLSFEQAAGHNLQQACHHVILFEPVYSGTDSVADASVEQQAIGRVVRQGQTSAVVTVIRLHLKLRDGSNGTDEIIIKRNTDEFILQAASSNFD